MRGTARVTCPTRSIRTRGRVAVSYAPFAEAAAAATRCRARYAKSHRRSRVLAGSNAWSTPIPDAPPAPPPRGFCAFLWACTRGLRPYLLAHRRPHRRDRRVRGAAVRMLGSIVDWLAEVEPAQLWDAGARHAAAARRRARREHRCWSRCSRSIKQQAIVRQLSDAAALELPPADARPEHGLLPGRVRRPHRDQGDADRARGARHLAHRRRAAGVRRHLLRHAARGARRLRRVAARAVPRLGRAVRRRAAVLRAAARPRRAASRPTRAR